MAKAVKNADNPLVNLTTFEDTFLTEGYGKITETPTTNHNSSANSLLIRR